MSTLAILQALREESDRGIYSAEHMREDLAKAYSNNEHVLKERDEYTGGVFKPHTFEEKVEYSTQQTGLSVARAVESFKVCLGKVEQLESHLSNAPSEADAVEIYDAYDETLDKYWSFVQALTTKMGDKGIKKYVGYIFKSLFAAHLKVFQQIGKSIGTGLGSKLEPEKKRQKPKPDGYNTRTPPPYYQTKEKLNEWTSRTEGYLQEGLKAAST